MGMSSVLEEPTCLADCPLIYPPAGWESTTSASQVAFDTLLLEIECSAKEIKSNVRITLVLIERIHLKGESLSFFFLFQFRK